MFTQSVQFASGDVVACGASLYIVHQVDADDVLLLRVESRNNARHRADVVPEHWSDIALIGLPFQDIVIRCVPVRRYGTVNLTKLGALPENLRKRVLGAVRKESQTRRFEDSPSVRSNLLASTASSGRRVNAVRYA